MKEEQTTFRSVDELLTAWVVKGDITYETLASYRQLILRNTQKELNIYRKAISQIRIIESRLLESTEAKDVLKELDKNLVKFVTDISEEDHTPESLRTILDYVKKAEKGQEEGD